DHLVGAVPHTSVNGVGGGGLSNAGDVLDGSRTYIWDKGGAADLADGIANRGDSGFAMMIWDFGSAFDSMRLYTHQDHYFGGPIFDPFQAQDVMEYSVWGSHDGDSFALLSDVIDFDIDGGGAGLPTYVFFGEEPSIVYRGGSAEFGAVNAYTREYVFSDAYRYYGIRTSLVSLAQDDADPEIDTIAAFNISDRPEGSPGKPTNAVPEPASLILFGMGAVGAIARKKFAA
ncbi:MAG: PEP-CTERM sorting domain-containing protein, partial [Candidatus Omnitrophica bacterium]|nr:PEP-CTERM sorting domain-containing protein [Candidatus Omnitrophota bacterium]